MSLAPGRPSQPLFTRSSSGTNLAEGFPSVQRNSMGNFGGQAVGERALRQARQFSRPQRHQQDPTSSKAHSDEAASSSRARHMEADSLA